jgi:ferredoxin-nitrite reductase
MDNVRNVVGCPLAGLLPTELLDASPVVRAFTARIVGNRAYTNLPRKFNVTITGCRENCTHAETQDLALVPAVREGLVGFNVLVGGKMGSGGYRIASSLDAFVTPDQAPEVCAAIVEIFRDFGLREARSKARLSFLLDLWGVERFREVLENSSGAAGARKLYRHRLGGDPHGPRRDCRSGSRAREGGACWRAGGDATRRRSVLWKSAARGLRRALPVQLQERVPQPRQQLVRGVRRGWDERPEAHRHPARPRHQLP